MRKLHPVVLLLGAVLAASGPAASGSAQAKRPMTFMDLLNIPRVIDPQLSGDGRTIAFTLLNADWKLGRRLPQVWRVNTDGTGLKPLTKIEGGALSERWSPDGSTLAVLAQVKGQMQIQLLPADGGDPKPLSNHPTAPSAIAWARDGRGLYFLASDVRSNAEVERERVRDDVFAFDENYQQQHLWRIELADGRETRITSGDYSVLSYKVAVDGRHLVINRAPSPQLNDGERSDVWLIDANGEHATRVTDNRIQESESELSPDNSRVLFVAGANAALASYYLPNLFVVQATGGRPRPVLPDFPYEVLRASWAKDGRSIYVVANMGVHSEIFRIDLAPAVARPLTDGRHSIE